MRRPRNLVTTALVLTSIAAAGCHDPAASDEEQVRGVLASFSTSVEKRDYQRLCDRIFAPKLLKGLQAIGLPCVVAMRQSLGAVKAPRLTVGAVTVEQGKADAEIKTSAAGQPPSSDTIRLEKLSGTWKVSALTGPAAASASPRSSP